MRVPCAPSVQGSIPRARIAAIRRACEGTAVLLLAFCCSTLGQAQAPAGAAVSEASVKAAFLYKFLAYTEWPSAGGAAEDAPIVIAVANASDVATEAQALVTGRTHNGRPIVVRRVKDGDQLEGVQVLYVGPTDVARLQAWVKSAQQSSTLVVTAQERALEYGSVINLLVREGRIRFDVSLEAAEASGLKLSSRMLSVANAVRPGRS